jgi:hypothetical protein
MQAHLTRLLSLQFVIGKLDTVISVTKTDRFVESDAVVVAPESDLA